jgi:hypothetical protein
MEMLAATVQLTRRWLKLFLCKNLHRKPLFKKRTKNAAPPPSLKKVVKNNLKAETADEWQWN